MPEATVTSLKNDKWTNRHETVTQPFERLFFIEIPDGDGTTIIRDMRTTASALQGILKDAIAANKRLRCIGGGWSLSNCAATDGWLIATQSLNLFFRITERAQVHPAYTKDLAGLYFAQCGSSVQEMNVRTARHGRSLFTTGASNGQTIAGAIATGTHGSAFHYGSVTEYVVGFHLITGPDEIIWLERASSPVVSDSFAAELGATLRRDDDLFNAVLVSFGSCGIVAGVMLETEPRFLFEVERRHLTMTPDVKTAMNTMNLANLDIPNKGEIPWHFEITFNPHKSDMGFVRTLFKRKFVEPYEKPKVKAGELLPGEGCLALSRIS